MLDCERIQQAVVASEKFKGKSCSVAGKFHGLTNCVFPQTSVRSQLWAVMVRNPESELKK